MRLSIIKGLLPWLLFFSFADGTVLGLNMASVTAFACFFIFNFKTFRRHFVLDNVTFVALLVFIIGGFFVQSVLLAKYAYLIVNIVLTLTCFIPLFFGEPFALQYARLTVEKSYWQNKMFQTVSYWITFIWGCAFLFSALAVGLFDFGVGTQIVMIKIIPTALIVMGLGFNILFPDIYKVNFVQKGSVAGIANLSPVKFVQLGSINMGYRLIGEGPLLVLMHDLGLNMHMWDPDFLQKLSQHFQVLIVDYPGAGHSSFENMPYTPKKISEYINQLVKQISLKPIAVVGYSMGNMIAETYVQLFKDDLLGVIFVANNIQGQLLNIWANNEISFQRKIEKVMPVLFPKLVIKRMQEKMTVLYSASVLEGDISKAIFEKQKKMLPIWLQEKHPDFKLPVLSIMGKTEETNQNSNVSVIEYNDASLGVLYQYPIDVAKNIESFLLGKINASR